MGAYYRAVIDGVMYSYTGINGFSPFKLKEYSYIRNDYMYSVIKEIIKKGSAKVVWLCDYHEPDDKVPYQWYWEDEEGNEKRMESKKLKTVKIKNFDDYMKMLRKFYEKNRYITNKDKKEFFDAYKIFELELSAQDEKWHWHPLSILTASDDDYMGGGDVDKEEFPLRATWRNDTITVFKEPPEGYRDITEKVIAYEVW